MTLEVDKVRHVVFRGESAKCVRLVLEDSLLDTARHSDVQNTPLATQNIDVVNLGHESRMHVRTVRVEDGCHVRGPI